jgi:hypothetical protein
METPVRERVRLLGDPGRKCGVLGDAGGVDRLAGTAATTTGSTASTAAGPSAAT